MQKESHPSLDMTDAARLFEYQYDGFPKSRISAFHNRLFTEANCQHFVHSVYDYSFGIILPDYLLSYEIFMPNDHFRPVNWPESEPLMIGDIIFFQRFPSEANASNFDPDNPMYYHMGIATNRFYRDNSPEILHHSWISGKPEFWPFHKFAQQLTGPNGKTKRWYEYRGVRRIREDRPEWPDFASNFRGAFFYNRKNPSLPVEADPSIFPDYGIIYPVPV